MKLTGTGPTKAPPIRPRNISSDRIARRIGIDVGQPAQAAHRRQRDDEGLQVEARRQPAVEEADRGSHRQRDGDRRRKMHLLLQAGGEQPGQRQHRADRQVDAAGADHHQHAEAEEAVGDDLARDVDDVALGQERVRRERREDDEQQDRRREKQVGAAEALQQRPAADAASLSRSRSMQLLRPCVLRRPVPPHARTRFQAGTPRARTRRRCGPRARRAAGRPCRAPPAFPRRSAAPRRRCRRDRGSSGRSRPWWRCRRRASARRR